MRRAVGAAAGTAATRGTQRALHAKVELGGQQDAVDVTKDVLKARETLEALTRQLHSGNATHIDGDALDKAVRALAAAGDRETLTQAHRVQVDAGELLRGASGTGVRPGRHATERMEAAVALGDIEGALAVLGGQFDGDSVPLTVETFAVLVDLLGVANADAADWEAVLLCLVESKLPLSHPSIHDALSRRFYVKSPLLAYLAYAWRLVCAAPMSPAAYAELVLAIFKAPQYTAVLGALNTIPEVPKNRFHMHGILENLEYVLSMDSRTWLEAAGEVNFGAEGDDAEGAAHAMDPLPRELLHLSSGMPPVVQVLPDSERALLRVLAKVIHRHAEVTAYPLQHTLRCLAMNCRASTQPGWIMRVLAEAHQTKTIRVGEHTYSHVAIYERIIPKLEEWGRYEDVCCMWRIAEYYSAMWQQTYNADRSEGAGVAVAAVPGIVIPVLRACARVGLGDVALDVVTALYYTNVWIDIALLNAIVAAVPIAEGGLKIYQKLEEKPNAHANAETIRVLLEACLKHALANITPRARVPPPTRARTDAPPPSSSSSSFSPTQAYRGTNAAWLATVRNVFPSDTALPEETTLYDPQKGASEVGWMLGAAGGRGAEEPRDVDASDEEAPDPAPDSDPFTFVLAEMKRLSYITPDAAAQSMLVANWLVRADSQAALAAAVALITTHHRPTHEDYGRWRAAALAGGVDYTTWAQAVDTALLKQGFKDRCIERSVWARGEAEGGRRVRRAHKSAGG